MVSDAAWHVCAPVVRRSPLFFTQPLWSPRLYVYEYRTEIPTSSDLVWHSATISRIQNMHYSIMHSAHTPQHTPQHTHQHEHAARTLDLTTLSLNQPSSLAYLYPPLFLIVSNGHLAFLLLLLDATL